MTAKELLDELTKMIEDYPPCADFPCIYSEDEERNAYHPVEQFPILAQMENIDEYELELNALFTGDDEITKEDCNCILIN